MSLIDFGLARQLRAMDAPIPVVDRPEATPASTRDLENSTIHQTLSLDTSHALSAPPALLLVDPLHDYGIGTGKSNHLHAGCCVADSLLAPPKPAALVRQLTQHVVCLPVPSHLIQRLVLTGGNILKPGRTRA